MNNEKEIESEIETHAYVAPCVERMQIQTEGGFAGSQSVNDSNSLKMDDWAKTTSVSQSSGTTIGSWDKE